jgi:nucleotide-binding universal stress UspA family protein
MYNRILVPIDGSDSSMLGLEEAIRLAKAMNSKLTLLHVVNELVLLTAETPGLYIEKLIEALKSEGCALLDKAERLVREHGLEPERVMVEMLGASAADEIVREAKVREADLIVMGTHGRRGLRRLALGSDAELVLRKAPVPVLLVREPAARVFPLD